MLTLRTLAIMMTGAALLAGLPLTDAQACDDDRFPCPVVSETSTQETTPSAQPRKKASRAARRNEQAPAKVEREAARVPAPTTAITPAAPEQTADSGARKEAGAAPALVLNDEIDRNESPVAAAAAAWLILPNAALLPNADGAGTQPATDDDATPAVPADGVQMVDANEVNELDLAAGPAPADAPTDASWLNYLLVTLGAALAAASTVRFFLV